MMSHQNSELLEQVPIAHGGLDRWRQFSTVSASIVTGGALWAILMRRWFFARTGSVLPHGACPVNIGYDFAKAMDSCPF